MIVKMEVFNTWEVEKSFENLTVMVYSPIHISFSLFLFFFYFIDAESFLNEVNEIISCCLIFHTPFKMI